MAPRPKILCLFLLIISTLIFSTSSLLAATQSTAEDKDFLNWLDEFYKEATTENISQEIFHKAFLGITVPDEKVLEKAAYQPEFTLTIWDYLDPRVNDMTEKKGKEMLKKHFHTLKSIEKELGIEPPLLLAIWSMETAYGAVLQYPERFFRVPHALATLAYADKKRARFGRQQLLAALKILETGNIAPKDMLGSWAGAMGHTQFIPTSYLAYGYDWDDNGKIDIWNSIPDALATAANLLRKNKYQTGKTWGYEVIVPEDAEKYTGETKLLSQWQDLGFLRVHDKSFPRSTEKAELKMLAGPDGPGYLMLKNFFVIKRYNSSDFYALAVGQLADRIAGHGTMVQNWPRPEGSLSFDQKRELQSLLKKHGFYDGNVDGYIGKGSRKAIQLFQKANTMQEDGEPSLKMLQKLQEHN